MELRLRERKPFPYCMAVEGLKCGTVQLKCDGTQWRTGGEVKGKLANGVGSQYPSHYLGTWCIQRYYRWFAQLGCRQSTELTPPADLNGLVHFAGRRNLVSARVPSHFNWPLTTAKPVVVVEKSCYGAFSFSVLLSSWSICIQKTNKNKSSPHKYWKTTFTFTWRKCFAGWCKVWRCLGVFLSIDWEMQSLWTAFCLAIRTNRNNLQRFGIIMQLVSTVASLPQCFELSRNMPHNILSHWEAQFWLTSLFYFRAYVTTGCHTNKKLLKIPLEPHSFFEVDLQFTLLFLVSATTNRLCLASNRTCLLVFQQRQWRSKDVVWV
jgi:hypothetical protein